MSIRASLAGDHSSPQPDVSSRKSSQDILDVHVAPQQDNTLNGLMQDLGSLTEKNLSKGSNVSTSLPPKRKTRATKSPAPAGISLQFVNTNGPSQTKDVDARKLVRAHVMREYRRKQRMEKVQDGEGDNDGSTPAIAKRRANLGRKRASTAIKATGATGTRQDRSSSQPTIHSHTSKRDLAYITTTTFLTPPTDLLKPPPTSGSSSSFETCASSDDGLDNDQRFADGSSCSSFGRPSPEPGFVESCLNDDNQRLVKKMEIALHKPQLPNPQSLMGASRIDPFAQLPVGPSDTELFYLDHWINVLAPGFSDPACEPSLTSPAKNYWLQAVTADDTLLYVTMYASAVHVDIMRGPSQSAEQLRLGGEAIHRINRNIRNPDTALTDGTIGSILFLAGFENIRGSMGTLAAHMNGVAQMVQLRGGIESMPGDSMLKSALQFDDRLVSAVCYTKPRFSTVQEPPARDAQFHLRNSFRYGWPMFNQSWLEGNCLANRGFNTSIRDILYDVSDLTAILEQTHNTSPSSDPSISALLAKRTSIENRLLSLPPASDPFKNPRYNDYIYESCRLASLIFLRATNYLVPFCDRSNQSLMRKLRAALEKSELDNCWHNLPGALMWPLMVGAAAALRDRERSFFMAHLVRVAMCIGPFVWMDIQESIMKFLWIEGLFEGVVRETI
ncbi:MAG: hypothetical protein M1835_000139 [Candelina submexicana]|nr:MAG: hypothetical protein M1835_000139 [Candelina submexicana]